MKSSPPELPFRRLGSFPLAEITDWEAVWNATQAAFSDTPLATWWVQASEGVNYYRAKMPAKHLPGKWVYLQDLFGPSTGELVAEGDNIIMPRQAGETSIWMFPGNIARWLLMAELHLQGKRVLVEVDDNYTVHPPIVLSGWKATRKEAEVGGPSYECHRAIVRSEACHGVIVSTPRLGEVYERMGKPVYVCPNSVDLGDWDFPVEHAPDDVLRIGWAGSASHAHDVIDIRDALDWAGRQRDVEVVVLGQLDLGIPCRQIPWTSSLEEYRRNVSELDVILCPIRPSRWSDCKSDVKALEGAMGGAVPVVSRTEPFKPWHDRTYVASRPKDYVKIVKHLVANREETRQAAADARAYVLAERTIEKSIHHWREALAA